jgi:hypothetical protein
MSMTLTDKDGNVLESSDGKAFMVNLRHVPE